MSEAVDSFNGKINEIKEDREKFEILMDEFFESKDINIKELLAEMMLHVIMSRGEELQIKFKELEDRRNMYGDWIIDSPGLGAHTIATPNIITSPGTGTAYVYPTWTYDNTYVVGGAGGGSSSGIGISRGCGTITINPSDLNNSIVLDDSLNNIVSSSNTVNVACAAQSIFSSLDIQSIVEDIDLDDSKVNTKLFENAVHAMSTWSSSTAE